MRLPVIPLALGLVLGDSLEASLRQTLTISDGSCAIFFHRPVAATIAFASLLMIIWPPIKNLWRRKNVPRWP